MSNQLPPPSSTTPPPPERLDPMRAEIERSRQEAEWKHDAQQRALRARIEGDARDVREQMDRADEVARAVAAEQRARDRAAKREQVQADVAKAARRIEAAVAAAADRRRARAAETGTPVRGRLSLTPEEIAALATLAEIADAADRQAPR